MSQLVMRRPDLSELPPIPPLPPGYTLREYRDSDLKPLAMLMQIAFQDPQWTPERLRGALVEAPDVKKIFIVDYAGQPVASASAQIDPKQGGQTGSVHWVAVEPAHRGKRLGYVVSLAVLHELARLGCTSANLLTDDYRLPAIKIYQSLGFVPEHTDESHPERWAKVIADLLAAANL